MVRSNRAVGVSPVKKAESEKCDKNRKQDNIGVSFHATYSFEKRNPKVFDRTKVKGLQCDRLAKTVSSIPSILFFQTYT